MSNEDFTLAPNVSVNQSTRLYIPDFEYGNTYKIRGSLKLDHPATREPITKCDCNEEYLSPSKTKFSMVFLDAYKSYGDDPDALKQCFLPDCSMKFDKMKANADNIQFEIFDTENRGYGVRSKRDIEMGEYISEYISEVFDIADSSIDSLYKFCVPAGQKEIVYDAANYGNVSRFINHSCEPNCISLNITSCPDFYVRGNQIYQIGFFAGCPDPSMFVNRHFEDSLQRFQKQELRLQSIHCNRKQQFVLSFSKYP
uniref:SET domain-containing protein n=1 Tax=Rhabditophanes sp. KR3021 TaxID=114890 RepID=A0AC35U146_9BILA